MLDSSFVDRNIRVLFPLPAVLFVTVMMAFPVAYTISISFLDWNLTTGMPPGFAGLRSYATVLGEPRFALAFVRTFTFSALAVGSETVLGVAWALVLNRSFAAKGALKLLLLMPMVSTPVAIGIAWTLFYEPTIGIANWALASLGLPRMLWIGDKASVIPSLALVDIWQWTPMIALIVLAALASLPQEPYESARVDGANALQTFVLITLPLLMPSILTAVILRSIDALKTFDIIYAMTNGGPGFASETLNIHAFTLSFNYFRLGQAAVELIVLFLVVFGFSLGVTRLRRRFGFF